MNRPALARNTVLLVVLLCAVACAQTASLTTESSHSHSSQHCCGLCHVGPLPFLESTLSSEIAPSLSKAWLEQSAEPDAPHEILLTGVHSRAPPA